MRPSSLSCRSSKLCAPSETRVTPGRAIFGESAALDRARIRLERDFDRRPRIPARARACSSNATDRGRRKQAGRATAEKNAGQRRGRPRSASLRIEIAQQRLDVALLRQLSRSVYELKSQYGHFCTHQGKCAYNASGGVFIAWPRSPSWREESARAPGRDGCACCFSSPGISAAVRVSPRGTNDRVVAEPAGAARRRR